MTRLSFGTVIDVLQQCRRNIYSKTDLTMAIINILIPENSCKNLKGSNLTDKLNSLYTCKLDLKTLFNDGTSLPHHKPSKTIIQQFEQEVLCFIEKDKRELAILALCDMIEKDCTLAPKNNGKNIEIFETYIKKSIQEFLSDKEYFFSEFLAEICLYTINEVKNSDGQEWVKFLTEKYKTSCGSSIHRVTYSNGFKNYIADFENNKREIQIWGTLDEKEKAQNTVSQSSDHISAPVSSEEETLGGETLMQYRRRTNTLHVRDIGPENQICLCCEHWIGDMENALSDPFGSIGKCRLRNEEKLSTNPMCDREIPSQDRANRRKRNIRDIFGL